jgi:hypothetical protein
MITSTSTPLDSGMLLRVQDPVMLEASEHRDTFGSFMLEAMAVARHLARRKQLSTFL